jgi:hypothetical protein
MPGWGDLLNEVNTELALLPPEQAGPALDNKRVGYLQKLQQKTGRPVVLYASHQDCPRPVGRSPLRGVLAGSGVLVGVFTGA